VWLRTQDVPWIPVRFLLDTTWGVNENTAIEYAPRLALRAWNIAQSCPVTQQPATNRLFTPGYVLYLLILAVVISGFGWWIYPRTRSLTLEDMARPDYVDRPDRILRKVNQDGVLHDLRPNTKTLHQGVEYATNADGQRDDHDHPLAKIPGSTRIVFLGDSFTFGWGLKLEYGFVKQLEGLLGDQKWEVINLGVPGYNTINEVAHFETAGLKYDPDVVVVMYHLNDAQSAVDTSLGNGQETFMKLVHYFQGNLTGRERERVEGFLREKSWPLDPPWNRRSTSFRNRTYIVSHYLPLYWEPTQRALKRLEDLSREHYFKLLVGIIPEIDESWDGYPFDDLHEYVAREMRSHGFGVLDLKQVLSHFPNKDLMLWGTDGHTSAYANRIIAQSLADRLTGR